MAEKNSYLLLELDPGVDDGPAIERRIEEKRREWSLKANQGAPSGKRAAQQALERLSEIRRILGDPDSRREEARAARQELQNRRREALRAIETLAKVLHLRGGYTAEDLAAEAKRHGTLTAAEIEVEFRRLGLGPRTAGARSGAPTRPRLDQVIEGKIRANLAPLGLRSLYEFLELPKQVSPAQLVAKADAIYTELRRTGRTDAEASARNDLVGLCKQVFGTAADKEKYDNGLAVQAMDGLRHLIEAAAKDTNVIDVAHLRVLLDAAKQERVDEAAAEDYIRDLAGRRKWVVIDPAASGAPLDRLVACGFCGTVAAAGDRCCAKCGEELYLACPRCGHQTPTDAMACAKCGANTGDWAIVRAAMKQVDVHVASHRYRDAVAELARVLALWPGWPPAVARQAELQRMVGEHESRLRSIEEMIRQGQLYAARADLGGILRAWGDGGDLAARVAAGIARAEQAFGEGEGHRRAGRMAEAVTAYAAALAICADHQAARQAMARCPPPPPASLRVEPVPGGYRLTWPAAPPPVDGYVVVRKANSRPDHDRDGAMRRQLRDCMTDDVPAEAGTGWHYAVYSERNGILSPSPARSGPHLIADDVIGLVARPGDREVVLEWHPPDGTSCVEVWRGHGAPPSAPGQGIRVSGGIRSAHDAGLANDVTYHYLVVAVYPDPGKSGQVIRAKGVRCSAMATAAPPPVMDLACRRDGMTVFLTWTPPTGVTVQIRQLANQPVLKPGTHLSADELSRYGTPVPTLSPGKAQLRLAGNTVATFLPFSIKATTAVVGRAQSVSILDAVTNLRGRSDSWRVALTWDWPAGAERVAVCWSHDSFPASPDQQTAGIRIVTRREYDQEGMWQLANAEQKKHYFSVFVLDPTGQMRSDGRTVLVARGHERSIRYRIAVKRRLLSRTLERVQLELEGEGFLPEALLVARVQRLPISAEDGKVILRVPPGEVGGHRVVPVPQDAWNAQAYAKLFFADPDQASDIRLLSGSYDDMKLG